MADDGPRRSTIIHRTLGPMRTVWGERVAPALMTPLGIVLTIPILVAGVGFLIWWQGRTAVDASVDALASRQFGDRAEQGAQHARDLLGHAAPLSDAIVAYVEREGITPAKEGFALRFRDLLRASPGVAYTSVGTRDGNFFGVYRDPEGRFVLTDRIYEGPDRTHTRKVPSDGTMR